MLNGSQRPPSPPLWQGRIPGAPPSKATLPELQRSDLAKAATALTQPPPLREQRKLREDPVFSERQYEAKDVSPVFVERQNLGQESQLPLDRNSGFTAEQSQRAVNLRRADLAGRPLSSIDEDFRGSETPIPPAPFRRKIQPTRPPVASGQPSRYWSRQETAQPRFYQTQKGSPQPVGAFPAKQMEPGASEESFRLKTPSGRDQAEQSRSPPRTASRAESLNQEACELGESTELLQQAAIIQSSPGMAFTDYDALWHPELGSLLQQQGRSTHRISAAGEAVTQSEGDQDRVDSNSPHRPVEPARMAEVDVANLSPPAKQARDDSPEGKEKEAGGLRDLQANRAVPPELDSAHPSIVPHEREDDTEQQDVRSDSNSEEQTVPKEATSSRTADSEAAGDDRLACDSHILCQALPAAILLLFFFTCVTSCK